jgi:Na+-translocating ferredoxin:NAD+ oxidoreductase RnfE subunit
VGNVTASAVLAMDLLLRTATVVQPVTSCKVMSVRQLVLMGTMKIRLTRLTPSVASVIIGVVRVLGRRITLVVNAYRPKQWKLLRLQIPLQVTRVQLKSTFTIP